ncbi:hypothetical protein D3C81_1697520 [compost metagenome]
MALAVPLAIAWVSYTQWMWLAVQYSLVMAEDAEIDTRPSLLVSSRMRVTAMVTADETSPATMSTLPRSIHSRVVLAPTSGLLRSSALRTTILAPLTWPPKSSTAMFRASSPPGPPRSR